MYEVLLIKIKERNIAERRDMQTREFDSRKHIAFLCDCISREFKAAVTRSAKDLEIDICSARQGWLVGYFVRQTEPIFQKDLEKVFHFPKSTLADMLSILEKDGLIERVPVDGDARRKQIVVTKKGLAFNSAAESKIMEVEDYIAMGISDEEMEAAINVLEKIQENARKYKEEGNIKKEA